MLLRSRAEVAVLGVVLNVDGLHLREIARRAGVSAPEAKRELDLLEKAGILRKNRMGNMSIYTQNTSCPFLAELKGLYTKTEGVIPVLKASLEGIAGLQYAFVYGSFASGSYSQKSDVDVMLIGKAPQEDVDRAFLDVQRNAGREVNYVLWTADDLKRKLREGQAFASSVLKGKRVWLVGDENDLKRDAQKPGNRKG